MIFGSESPLWFLGIDSLFEGTYVLALAVISWYAWRIHSFGGGKSFKWWSLGIASLAAAYVVNALTNLALYQTLVTYRAQALSVYVVEMSRLEFLGWAVRISRLGFFLHAFLFLLGYLMLVVVSLKVRERKHVMLLGTMVLLLAFAAISVVKLLELTVAILLLALIFNALEDLPTAGRSRKLVIAGFMTLFLAQVVYLFMPLWPGMYVFGHILELVGYGWLFGSMLMVLRK